MKNFDVPPREESEVRQMLVEQFEHPDEIDFNGKRINVVDIAPSAEKLKTETPTLVVPGFSATPEALKEAILQTAQAGRRVISADAPHGIDTKDAPERDVDLPDAEKRKLELLLELLKKKGINGNANGKVNVILHSEAGDYVTAAAERYPELFLNIVLVESAGLVGKDDFLSLIKRTAEDTKEQAARGKKYKPVEYPSPASVGIKSIFGSPSSIVHSAKEVNAIAHADITKRLKKIHDAGIGIAVIHAADDKTFPMDRVQKMVSGAGGSQVIDGFYSVEGTHNNMYLYDPFVRAAEMALTALEEKKKKAKEAQETGV